MGQPQSRMFDNVLCAAFAPSPAGPVPGTSVTLAPCALTVLVGKVPAARMGDIHPSGLGPHPIAKGSTTVLMEKKPAARMGDPTGCGGSVVKGLPTVLTGG